MCSFGEALAGGLVVARALIGLAAPVALFVGTFGAISGCKAVYVDKRELICACVGGFSNVPLGFVTLTDNVMRYRALLASAGQRDHRSADAFHKVRVGAEHDTARKADQSDGIAVPQDGVHAMQHETP